ncbi:Ubiquitin thioesterase otubain, partial [Globisporangium splendens]
MAEQVAEWMLAAKQGPLVSDPMSALCLKAEYAGNANENFLFGIESLAKRYDAMRRVRGDGNCFFRAFIFALCEQLLSHDGSTGIGSSSQTARLRARIEETIRASKTELIAVGYSEIAIDAFWETFVWYARLLTAGHLKKHAETFQPFIEGLFPGLTVEQFCAAEVEPMGKECDQPQIAALTEVLNIGVKIEYLDGSGKELQTYECSPSASSSSSPRSATQDPVTLYLLYRPGHYDILYPRAATPSSSSAAAVQEQ